MYSKNWLVIKDDSRRTYEVCGKEVNTDSFMNKTLAMQRAGMNVTGITPPVTNRTASKAQVTVHGYTVEEGLYERLSRQLDQIRKNEISEYDIDEVD